MAKYIKIQYAETIIYNGSNKDEVVKLIKESMTYEQEKLYRHECWDFTDWEQVQSWMVDILDDWYINEGDEVGIFGGKFKVISPEGQAEGILEGQGWKLED